MDKSKMPWLDFLKPRVLEEYTSALNGLIQVMELTGDRYISTGHLTQSGGLVREVWQKNLDHLSREKGKSWLILGLAGGTLAKYISKKNHPQKIVGVEIDPVMVTIGKKYFDLNQISELKIITKDALEYLKTSVGKFDRILVDMYYGDTPPKFIYSQKFFNLLISHLNPGGTVVFNHLFYDSGKKNSAHKLISALKPIFSEITLERKLTNLLISCRN